MRNTLANPRSVWITGTGVVSCLGAGVENLWQSTLDNRSGIHEGLGRVPHEALPDLPADLRENRALAFCVTAAKEAMAQAGWDELRADDGLILATTTGQLLLWDFSFVDLINGHTSREDFRQRFLNQPLGELLSSLSRHLNHNGPTSLLTSACSASTQALALGAMWIRQGRVKRCLIAGAEVLCELTCEGFRSLQLLSRTTAQPFDRDRNGINLSEGAAVLCLEAEPQPSRALAQISGFGFSTDGYHMTGPHPEGDGSYRAMRGAVELAKLEPKEIDWVHAHGTGSTQNDLSEGLAVRRLFGESEPWVSSTKWLHGHALAASGAIESALIVKAIQEQTILFTRGLAHADEKIPVRHPKEDLKQPLKHVLKNTLGFGGANAALIFSHPATGER